MLAVFPLSVLPTNPGSLGGSHLYSAGKRAEGRAWQRQGWGRSCGIFLPPLSAARVMQSRAGGSGRVSAEHSRRWKGGQHPIRKAWRGGRKEVSVVALLWH